MGMIMNTSSTVACKAVRLDNTQSCIDFLIYIGMAAVGAVVSPGIQKSETCNRGWRRCLAVVSKQKRNEDEAATIPFSLCNHLYLY